MKMQKRMNRHKPHLFKALSLFLMLMTMPAGLSLAQTGTVTEQNLQDAVLEQKTFTDENLREMDINKDNYVDVADIIKMSPDSVSASFEQTSSVTTEGMGTVGVKVVFSKLFTGKFKYSISGTALAGTDYDMMNTTLSVNGSASIYIPIPVKEDAELEDPETVELSIYYNDEEELAYIPGPSLVHTLYIYDNDALWNGSLESDDMSLHFQMRIIQGPSGASGALVTDGYGIIPLNGTGKEWPASGISISDTSFAATVNGISVTNPFGVTMTRNFVFNADASQSGQTVSRNSEIRGEFTESVLCSDQKQFERSNTGKFTLIRQIAIIKAQEIAYETVR